MHPLLVEAVGARAVVLGAVERDVGVAQHLVGGRLLAAVDERDARRGRDGEPPAGELERLRERVQEVAGHLPGGFRRGARLEQHGELVAAEARGGVAGGEPLRQPAGADAQELVARGVAERVVDLLEVVQVEEEDGEALLRGGARVERVLEAVDEQRAVREVGQRVVERAVGEPVLQRDAVRDVAGIDDGAADGRVVEEVRALVLDPPVGAVAVAPAHEQRAVDGARAVQQALVLRAHPLPVVGVHDVDQLGPGERLGRVAEHVLDRRRLEADGAVLVQHGHDVGGVVDQGAVPGVGLAAGEPGSQPGGLERHAKLTGEGLEHGARAVVDAGGRPDGEHALRLAAAEGEAQRVRARVPLDDDAVAVGDGDRAARLRTGELRDGREPGLDHGVAVGGRDERPARPAQRALARQRAVVAGGRAGERVEHDAAEDEQRELDERDGRAPRDHEHGGRPRERGEVPGGVEPATGAGQVRGVLGHGAFPDRLSPFGRREPAFFEGPGAPAGSPAAPDRGRCPPLECAPSVGGIPERSKGTGCKPVG